ncbi:MAG: response regulator transcription factor [Verrucomicrobiales bacterium]|nr:response regulator transcription factor [Verrucomicrobiales bacterium]
MGPSQLKILIADDHEVVRRGLELILSDEFQPLLVGEASNDLETLSAARRESWDIILLDINMPTRGGLDILPELRSIAPSTPVLILSVFPERDYAIRAFKLGAAGYLTKQSASDELLLGIRKALSGGRYVSSSLAEKLALSLSGENPIAPHERLSNRELQVLRLITTGKTVKEIAADMCLSDKTISTYRARIAQKMRIGTNVELTRYAIEHHLVE